MSVSRADVTGGTDNPSPASPGDTKPAWLPEKFDSPEAFRKSYDELERKMSAPAPKPAPAPKTADENQADLKTLDTNALAKEWSDNNGKLTAETLASLKEKGISQEFVQDHLKGQQAIADQITNEIAQAVGGAENLKSLYSWAEANLSLDEMKEYNKLIDSGSKMMARLAVEGLSARHAAAVGKDPTLVDGEASPAESGAKPFASNAQVIEAMRDPRYEADPAYREEIKNRMRKTELFNIRSL